MTTSRFPLALALIPLLIPAFAAASQEPARWKLSANASGISTDAATLLAGGKTHGDHLAMGGRRIDAIIEWRVTDTGAPEYKRIARFPLLRDANDDTHSSFNHTFHSKNEPQPLLNGAELPTQTFAGATIDTGLTIGTRAGPLSILRTTFPSVEQAMLMEKWAITNTGKSPVTVTIPRHIDEKKYPGGAGAKRGGRAAGRWAGVILRTEWIGAGQRTLAPGESMEAALVFSGREDAAGDIPADAPPFPDIACEHAARETLARRLENTLRLDTPNDNLDRMFALAKLRSVEAIATTRGGLMQGPGGYNNYVAAVWCNDNAEYMAPFHAYLGDAAGVESGRVTYAQFARFMNPDFKKIPSSVIAEGRGTWGGAGDRGDAAMVAQGAARFLLVTGDRALTREIWPFVEWCLEYCEKQKTADGVIASNRDELEGRFSSGKTNLATSSLTYDALVSAAHLAREIGLPEARAKTYEKRAADLRAAIERHFGATLEGFATYRYHEGLGVLRAWICLPVAYGVTERAKGTIDAVFSDKLWTTDGLLTDAKSKVFWDRSTLFALRAGFIAGETDRTLEKLESYTTRRLLGKHVPYAVEAYPEYGMSHLSGESGLYARVFLEGLFGLRPTGFESFELTPRLPKTWPSMSLNHINAHGRVWSVEVTRTGASLRTRITDAAGRTLFEAVKPDGATLPVRFPPQN